MEKKERSKAIKLIKSLWCSVEYGLDNCSISKYGDQLLSICKEESKQHDRFRSDSIGRGITVLEEAKYFALKRLLESLYTDYVPDLDSYHHMQKSVFMAYSVANEFASILKESVSKEDADYILSLDYCQLIEVE